MSYPSFDLVYILITALSRYLAVTFLQITHDDVIKWRHFPRYWPFVRGIHRSPVNSPHRPVTRSFDVFFDLQWWGWWIETPSCPLWRHCNVTEDLSSKLVCCAQYDAILYSDFSRGYSIIATNCYNAPRRVAKCLLTIFSLECVCDVVLSLDDYLIYVMSVYVIIIIIIIITVLLAPPGAHFTNMDSF